MSVEKRVVAKLRAEEGVRARVYKCSLGFDTVGIGFNMERPDARVRLKAIGADYDAVRSGRAELSTEEIDCLLMREINVCLTDLRTLIADFDAIPDDVRVVLVDMRFQLGAQRLKSLAAKQTPKRWARNAKLVAITPETQ